MTDFSGAFPMMELARNSSLGNECYQAEGRVTRQGKGRKFIEQTVLNSSRAGTLFLRIMALLHRMPPCEACNLM